MTGIVRTRFAPSPTGSLHVGGVRTALYCLLTARQQGGRFVLRIEDTDQVRSTDEAARGILADLEWLGLGWDEGPNRPDAELGPYYQSQRLDTYNRYIDELLASGAAYEAWESRAELDAMRTAAQQAKINFRYRPQPYSEEDLARFVEEGRKPVVRLHHPTHAVTVHDDILGEITIEADDLDDIVIRKADGFPTYHFAVVIDDSLMKITHVLRGQEHLMNTHKHLGIYEALGWENVPAFGHMPLIFNPEGGKMSKRDKAKAARAGARAERDRRGESGWEWLAGLTGCDLDDLNRFMKKKHDGIATANAIATALDIALPLIEVMDYRVGGYVPEAVVNYLALLGWSPGDDREIMTLEEMADAFRVARIGKTPARFDPQKLAWMNGEYLRSLPIDRILELHDQYLDVRPDSPLKGVEPSRRTTILELFRGRSKTFSDLDDQIAFLTVPPTTYDAKSVKKWLRKGGGLEHLAATRQLLADLPSWTAEALFGGIETLAATREVGLGRIAQPLRVAIRGSAVTPPLGETLALLSRSDVLARIDHCLAAHEDVE